MRVFFFDAFSYQRKYLLPIVYKRWDQEMEALVARLKNMDPGLILIGDAR